MKAQQGLTALVTALQEKNYRTLYARYLAMKKRRIPTHICKILPRSYLDEIWKEMTEYEKKHNTEKTQTIQNR